MNELEALKVQAASDRQRLEVLTDILAEKQAAFSEEYAELIASVAEAKANAEMSEGVLRDRLVAAFVETGDKKPVTWGYVVENKTVAYHATMGDIEAYCRQNWPGLFKFDRKAFDKAVLTGVMGESQMATVELIPAARLDKDWWQVD